MRKQANRKSRNIVIALVVGLALIAAILACSLDWNNTIPGGTVDEITSPPAYGSLTDGILGDSGAAIGSVPSGHVPTGTAITNANKDTLRNATSGNYYLAEDITDYAFNNLLSTDSNGITFSGTLDGNGHSITVTGGTYTYQKTAGGIFGVLESDSAVVKNLTVIYDSSITLNNGFGDGSYFGVGLVVGQLKYGTIQNVKVKVNAGVTISVNGNGNRLASLGGFVGQAGARNNASAVQKIERSALELNGTLSVTSGNNWTSVGGIVGYASNNRWVNSFNVQVNQFVLSGSGAIKAVGGYGRRASATVGAYESYSSSSNSVTVNGLIYDMTDSAPLSGDQYSIGVGSDIDGGSDHGGTATVNYVKTNRAVVIEGGGSAKIGSLTLKGTLQLPSLTGITLNEISYDAEGYITFVTDSTRTDFIDFIGMVNGTQSTILNNWKNYKKVNARICQFGTFTGSTTAALGVLAPEAASNATQLLNALKQGRSVSVNANIDMGATAFEANIEYKGMILGNNKTITFTGVSSSAFSDTVQGGLVKTLNGASVNDLTIRYSATMSKAAPNTSGDSFVGLFAGHAYGGTVISNVKTEIADGVTITASQASAMNISFGGILGLASGEVTLDSVTTTVGTNAKLVGGGGGNSAWTWTGGILGNVNGTGLNLTMNKIAVYGKGSLEGQSTGQTYSKRVAGLIGGVRQGTTGAITLTDYVYALNTLSGNAIARVACYDGGTPSLTLTGYFYTDDGGADFHNVVSNQPSVSSATSIAVHPYDKTGQQMPGIDITVSVNADFTKLTLDLPEIEFDPEFMWSIELKSGGSVVLDSATLFNDATSYTLSASLQHYASLGVYMKQSRSVSLPSDANKYEHGYVPSGYAQQQGYYSNDDWTEINNTVNGSMLANLSGGENYFLTEDLTVAGFVSTNNFSGVLDGCGHTVTLIDSGAMGIGLNGNLGGLFAELTGVVKNVRVVVKTSVSSGSGIARFGLLAGRMDSGAKLYNVKVSYPTGFTAQVSLADNSAITMGGIAGLVEGSDAAPVEFTGVTMELNGELRATGKWSWMGGIAGRVGHSAAAASGTRKLIAKQVVFRGDNGNLNNVDVAGETTERTAGFATVGGYGTAQVCTLDVDGFIFEYSGKIVGQTVTLGAMGDSNVAKFTLKNAYRTTSVDMRAVDRTSGTYWYAGFASGATSTNETVVESAFTQNGNADSSLGYTVALFDPAAINTSDGTVNVTDSLILAAIFEDGKENQYFVADIEIIYGTSSKTGTEAVSLINFFQLTPTSAFENIIVQIRSGSASDGIAGVDGSDYNSAANSYTDGWLTDNGRVPSMVGVPTGATAISSQTQLINWLEGKNAAGELLETDSVAYLYGYLTATGIIAPTSTMKNRTLAAGRTLDGMGREISVAGGGVMSYVDNYSGWMTGSSYATKLIGELVSVNYGTIKNLTMNVSGDRGFTSPAQGQIYGVFAAVNEGIIENCKTKISSGTILPRSANTCKAIIFGGIAGVNRGTIRYATIENNSTVDLSTSTTAATQKIAGGIAGVNDGGTMEYLISQGTGIYTIANASTYKSFLGGIVGYARISSAAPTVPVGASGAIPARGTIKNVLHNFEGTFQTGGSTVQGLYYGAIAGYIMPNSPGSVNTATGWFAGVKNGASNTSYGFFQANGTVVSSAQTLQYTGFAGGDSGVTNSNYGGGGVINVTYNGTANSVASNANHHFWWDYWGGSGELRYEVYNSATVNQMTATGTGATANSARGTAVIKNTATISGAPTAYTITTTFYNDGSYYDYLNGINNFGKAATSQTTSGTDLASGWYNSSGQSRLSGSGNFYLSSDVTIGIDSIMDVAGVTFSGTFDGNGHTITITGDYNGDAFTMTRNSRSHFGILTDVLTGTFKNVKIAYNAKLERIRQGGNPWTFNTGILTGECSGTIENVSITMGTGALFISTVTANGEGQINRTGVLCGGQTGGTIKNCSVDYGTSFTMKSDSSGGGGRYAGVCYRVGLIGEQSNNASLTNLLVKGTASFHGLQSVPRSTSYIGAIVGYQPSGSSISNLYLDNMTVTLQQDNAPTWTDLWGDLTGTTSDGNSSGSVSNVYLIGTNQIKAGEATSGGSPTPNQGVVAGSFFGNSLDAMLSVLQNAKNLSSQISNGINGMDTTAATRNLFVNFADYKISNFSAGYKLVLRYPELGYYITSLLDGSTTLTTANAESTYGVTSIASDSKIPSEIAVGVRAKVALIYNKVDENGNTVAENTNSNIVTQDYTGRNTTAYEFRPVAWGDGTTGTGSTVAFSWDVGGKITSGRVPTDNALTATMAFYNDQYAYWNPSASAMISIDKVQFSGTITYQVLKVGLEVESDTGGADAKTQWKDRGLLTFRLSGETFDSAMNQVVYSLDGGLTWMNVLKCNNYQNGQASVTVSFESQRGGSTIIFRAYDGVSQVSYDSDPITVRVDTSYPVIEWEENSEKLSGNQPERYLVVDDVSSVDLGKEDNVLTISGPDGHNLDYELTNEWRTDGKIRVFVNGDVSDAVSGNYTFTVKDALGRTRSVTETLDFTPPVMDASITYAEANGIVAINNPETTVSLSLTDNYSSSENILKTLKAYFLPQGEADIKKALHTLSVKDGTILTSGFNAATGMGNVILSLQNIYKGAVDIVFEATDDAGNVRRLNVLQGRNVILDTREYTLNVKKPLTDENPYELNGLSYRVNGSSYTAIAGEGEILHILRARLFDTVEIVYTKKAGYTYDGYQLVLGGQTLGTVPQGTQYVLGAFSQEDLSDDNNRTIVFLATQELKIEIPTTASGLGALKNGNYSDTVSDYTDAESGKKVFPNFLAPTATVFTYSTATGDYTDDAKFQGAVLKDYFDIALTDPNGNNVAPTDVDGVETLTFAVDPDSAGALFIEGSYTLRLSLKEGLRNRYTVLEGATATFTVSAKSRRAVEFTYPGETLSFVYNGEQNLLDASGNIFVGNGVFQPWAVDFAPDAFDEEERTEADNANLETLKNGLNQLNYTLYGNGELIGSKIGGVVSGKLAVSDAGTYYLTVSIPITGAMKFNGVTGALQIAITVTKKTVDVYGTHQSVMYGDAIDQRGYTFEGLVASDTNSGGTDGVLPSDVKDGVLTSFPRVSTEYSAVRVVNGVVTAYRNGAVLTGGIAKNYNFVLHSADLTIVPRDIVLKISDSRKTYGESDPNFAYWALSDTASWTDNGITYPNRGFGYSDNYLAFIGSEFRRDSGEEAGRYENGSWTQNVYKIYGVLTNPNYNIRVEDGNFRIARRELIFNITGDQGLIFEEGITHSVSAKIANALTKDNLTVAVDYVSGDWSSIGTHYYRLVVSKDGQENSDALFANYTYNQADIPVVIGASILNIVVLPQVLTYGSAPLTGEDWYILEGIKEEDRASVQVTLNIPKEYQKVGYHAGAISAEVTFTSANVNYTPIVRKGNLTVIPQSVELNWSGDFNSVYTGDALDKRITATVKTATSDPLQVTIAFSSENGSAVPRDAGNYTATASLAGSNSENYVVTAKDRTRQFIVQKSEQRISVSDNFTYNPETTEYPTFNAERQYAADYNGELVYRARINYLTLLSVAVNTATGYRPTTARIPSITVYSLTSVSSTGVGTNALRKFTPGDLNYFELEAGTYTAVAELAGDNNHYSNAYLFTFVVRETQNRLNTSPTNGNSIDSKTIQGSYVANNLGDTVSINDDSKLGYTVGPNTKHREVVVQNGSVSRLMANSLEGSSNGSAYNTLESDGYYGSHDGDWAYAYFNISVSEQLRQQILQGKVNMQIDLTAASMSAGIQWYRRGAFGVWTMVDGAWREDTIDTTNLSYMVREISSADDIAPDAADASWIGLDDNPYNINSAMMKYGQTEGFNVVSNGVELLQPGELSPYQWWDGSNDVGCIARHVDKSSYSKTITLTKDNVKSGSAFRVYLISSTIGATRASTQISGDLGQASRYLGNKRNNFLFEGISVKFVENTNASPSLSSDTAAPQVSASLFQDTATKGMKYRFDIRDEGTGIDFSSVSATVGGIKLTPGNGLNLVVKDYTNKSNSPILSSATFETGVISTASDLGEFSVRDYAGNRYRSTPSVSTDKIAPTLGDVKLSATGTFDSGQDILASETFWYNKKQYLSVSASDNDNGTGITESGIYYYDESGNRQNVDTMFSGGRIVTTSALPTGLYYIYAEDREGNLTIITFNLLVDESAQDGTLEIVLDPSLTPPDGESEGSWQKGNVVIENTVTSFGNSFGRMYYATSTTDFKDNYQTDPNLQWFAMDVELRDGKLVLSETITTATKKYYAFKYVAGAASYPGADDNVTVYKYYGLIMIDREEPSISAESYKVSERDGLDPAGWTKDGLNSAEWTNNDVVFEFSGTTGLSKGRLEYTLYGVNADDSLWYRPGDAGYEIYYWDYVSGSYTQTFDDTRCFKANNANETSFDYKAYLLLTGQNTGNVYAFRFRNGAGSEAVSSLGVTDDGRDIGFRVAIDKIAPEVTSINSSWQPNETKSQIYIRESDSGVKSVTVYQQKTTASGDGIFENGIPQFEDIGYSAENTNGRWYYTFKGVFYRIVVEDVAGNVGENQVKLKIDTRDPTVSLEGGAPIYSNRYVADGTSSEEEKLGSGVWAYRDANGVAYIEFKFTVSGGISGYTFAYSTVGFTSIESEWIKPGGIYDQAELDQDSGGYTHSFTFRLEADRAETYLFRFTSGAQKSVYFNFSLGCAEPYQAANENDYNYRVNVDATPATAENFEFGKDSQWFPLARYDDSRWVTEEAVAIRFTASEHTVNHASTGIGRVTYQKAGGEETAVAENGGYYIFYLTETKDYTVRVYDKAGNVTEYEIPAKKIDLVAPAVNITATTESDNLAYTENNPTKDNVRLKYEFVFGDSGIASIGVSYGNRAYTKEELEEGIVIDADFKGEISVTLTNGAGKSFTKTFEVQVDKTKPTAVITGLPETDTVEPVEITIVPQDENGSGVKSATLTYDDNGSIQTIDILGGYTFTVRDWREYTVTVEDFAGNVETISFAAKVDATVPENFAMTAEVNGMPYVYGEWSTSAVTLNFSIDFQTVSGSTNYGNVEYRKDGGAWNTLFYAGDAEFRVEGQNSKFRYVMEGEIDGVYEFRATTLSGNVSAETAKIDRLMIDTVTPELTAVGLIGGEGGAEFVPNTERGYTWISADVEITFSYLLGHSGGTIYEEYKSASGDTYVRKALFENLSKDRNETALTYTVKEEGFYRFVLRANADNDGTKESTVDYGEIKRDEIAPTVSVSSYQRVTTGDGSALVPYTPAMWTKNSVIILVQITLGASYRDSMLYISTGDSVPDFKPASNFSTENAEMNAEGRYFIVYHFELSENQMLNYDFRMVSGAGVIRQEELRRSGGAVRIDKNTPELTIESVKANGVDYAVLENGNWTLNGNGWTNQNVTFTFKVRTYLSGGTLKYTYDGLAGYTSDNIASYGSSSAGTDEQGNTYTERRYTLTLSGESFAIDAEIKFRVESGSGVFSNDETDGAKKVSVKIDKTRPMVDENSVRKTPNVPANTYTAQDVIITFSVYDRQIAGISSGVKKVEFGQMSGSIFAVTETLTADESGNYKVTVRDNGRYLIRVTDEAGNYSDYSVQENVDKAEPVIQVNTDYAEGTLSTAPITFNFLGSVYGVSGAKAQYRLDSGAWIDAADVNGTFSFNETLFDGTLFFRLLTGAGVSSAEYGIRTVQDLTDYRVDVTETVVANGSYSDNINYVKNGNGTATAPLMKKGETLTLQISEKAAFPLYEAYVNGSKTEFTNVSGRQQFEITVSGDTKIELKFREIISVSFDTEKLNQSIRVVDGKNTPVTVPFYIAGEHPGFDYKVKYQRVNDEYGNPVEGNVFGEEIPQTLGTYRILFESVGDYTALYQFSESSSERELKVYYFDKIEAANVEYYEIRSAYDLRYIRYNLADGIEFRQTRDLTVTSEVAAANGGDWTVGNLSSGAVYNGANYRIVFAKMDTAAKSLFGDVAEGATVKNVGLVMNNPILNIGTGENYAALADSVSGTLRNAYVTGSVRISGQNASVGGVAVSVNERGVLANMFSGLKIDVTSVGGDSAAAAGIALYNNGSFSTVFSAGSVNGKQNFNSGNMVAYDGNGSYTNTVTIESTLYSGTNVLESALKEGVTVVKYWDLNDTTKNYWDTAILAETLSPKAEQVNLKNLVDGILNGLTFETDEWNNRYIPVSSYEQLTMIDHFLWADYRQTADIDVKGRPLTIASNAPFTGSYDGKGYVIANVSGEGSSEREGYGLFGYVTGTIQNVVLKELNVHAEIASKQAVVGGLVQHLVGGVVKNVSVGGAIVAGVPNGTLTVGGVVGRASDGAQLKQILNTVSVTTLKATTLLYAGSIVGVLSGSSVENVYSIAKVDAYYTRRAAVGQLIGAIEDASEPSYADYGYSVIGVTYLNGAAKDAVVGYDVNAAAKENFSFISFDEMMDANRNPFFTVNGKHVSLTLKTLFPFQKGTGIESDPFEIRTAEEFMLIDNYLYAYYNVMNDIDFGGNFETIGKGMKFTGSIAGVNSGNETIRKLSGLTGALVDQNYGRIQSLELQTNVTGSVPENTVFGAAANENYGTVSFVKANGRIELNGEKTASLTVGGLVGKNYGRIEYSASNFIAKFGTVDLKFGGITGISKGGTLFKNIVEGSVNATVLTGTVGMFAGVLDDANCITRQTNTAGDVVDVFLKITVNKQTIGKESLYGVKLS